MKTNSKTVIKAMVYDVGGERSNRFRFQYWISDTPRQKKALEFVQEWADSWEERKAKGEGLVIYGNWGTGKTHLAFAAAGRIADKHDVKVKWSNGRRLMSNARDLITDDGLERDLTGPLVSAELLILDDPMPERGIRLTNYQRDLLYLIMDRRNVGLRPTIVTLNAESPDDARTRIGDAVWERIMADAWLAHFNWESRRTPSRTM